MKGKPRTVRLDGELECLVDELDISFTDYINLILKMTLKNKCPLCGHTVQKVECDTNKSKYKSSPIKQ